MAGFISSARTRNIFLIVFIVSTLVSLVLWVLFTQTSLSPFPVSSGHPNSSNPVIEIGGLVASVGSCLTSIVSFFGLAATVFFSWRKEKRESQVSVLDRQRLQIELEKQRLEVSRLRAEEKK